MIQGLLLTSSILKATCMYCIWNNGKRRSWTFKQHFKISKCSMFIENLDKGWFFVQKGCGFIWRGSISLIFSKWSSHLGEFLFFLLGFIFNASLLVGPIFVMVLYIYLYIWKSFFLKIILSNQGCVTMICNPQLMLEMWIIWKTTYVYFDFNMNIKYIFHEKKNNL